MKEDIWYELEQVETTLRYKVLDKTNNEEVKDAVRKAIDNIMYAKFLTH